MSCKDCVHFKACVGFMYSEIDTCKNIEASMEKHANDNVCDLFKNAADVVEVMHGEWIMTDLRFAEMSCSICGFTYYGEYDEECMSKYCPECGAKMDGERGEG